MYKRILIATDGSEKSKAAAKEGLELAKALGAQVIALNVVMRSLLQAPFANLTDRKDVEARLKAAGEKAVEELKSMGASAGINIDTVVRMGAPATAIRYRRGRES